MKRTILFPLIVAISLVCTTVAGAATTFINIGTGSTGGTYYPVGAAMASIWNKTIPNMKAASQSTGGTAQNLQLLENGEAEVGFTDGLYYSAYNGLSAFKGKPMKFLRGVTPLYPEPVQLMVAEGSGITSVKGLKGKRVIMGAVGSGTEYTSRTLLKVAGIDPDKDIKAQNLGLSEMASALADRNVDAAFMMAGVGASAIVEVATMGTGHLIPLEDEIITALNKELPYYTPFTIPANSYKGQTKALKVAATWNTLTAHEKLPTELVYQMTKALYENKQELVNVAASLSFMDASEVGAIQIPLHPGAEKYYKEIGAIK